MAGKVKNCKMCGKLFADYHKSGICMDCEDKVHDIETAAVNYVRDNPKAKITEILENVKGATEHMIKKMIREGRFEQVGVKMTYPCEKCGAPILTGKLCQQCTEKVRNDLQAQNSQIVAARHAAEANRGQGMHSKRPDKLK